MLTLTCALCHGGSARLFIQRFPRFTPRICETFKLKNSTAEYICLKVFGEYKATLKNKKTGWTLVANGLGRYPDGSIDWDFSTEGHFEKE